MRERRLTDRGQITDDPILMITSSTQRDYPKPTDEFSKIYLDTYWQKKAEQLIKDRRKYLEDSVKSRSELKVLQVENADLK